MKLKRHKRARTLGNAQGRAGLEATQLVWVSLIHTRKNSCSPGHSYSSSPSLALKLFSLPWATTETSTILHLIRITSHVAIHLHSETTTHPLACFCQGPDTMLPLQGLTTPRFGPRFP